MGRGKVGQTKFSVKSLLLFIYCFEIFIEGETLAFNGLNRWSFLSPNQQHDLYSDLLCPNPMVGGTDNRIISSKYSTNNSVFDRSPIPNDIWALKTSNEITFLPCDLKQYASFNKQHLNRFNSSNSIQNQILLMNLSLNSFNFRGAKLCNKFIKLQFDEEDGVELTCDENPLETDKGPENHIHWPKNPQRRRKSFTVFNLFKNLEHFLQNEETLRSKFYFQIYFTSSIYGRNKKCTVQQYELNLSNSGCNSRTPPRIEDVCGEFNCDDLIFPYYKEDLRQRVKFNFEGNKQLHGPSYAPNEYNNQNITLLKPIKPFYKNLDIRFVVFITTLPILLLGILIFGLEIIIYITCLSNRSRNTGEGGRDQHILQNSLNLWESIPNREIRSVSFSPVTTNIDMAGSESPLPDPHSTPKVLKSALKKSTEHLPPPPASWMMENMKMNKECPPTYVEAMKH